jgi:hypothetical protein
MAISEQSRGPRGKLLSAEHLTQVFVPYTNRRPWGHIDMPDMVSVARSGLARYRLSVYPPGTSETERHELVLARCWWIGGGFAALLGELILISLGRGLTEAASIALIWAAGAFYGLSRTTTIRHGTRVLSVVVMATSPREIFGDRDLYNECCIRLGALEEHEHRERLNPVEYEAIWADVYDRMPPR